MKKILFLMGLCLAFNVEAKQVGSSTEVIKRKIIQESIESYPGNCPCPYNTARGYTPYCYPEDVSDREVKEYKEKKNLA